MRHQINTDILTTCGDQPSWYIRGRAHFRPTADNRVGKSNIVLIVRIKDQSLLLVYSSSVRLSFFVAKVENLFYIWFSL